MKIDSKGNIIIGTTAILIVSLLLIAIFVFTSLNYIENQNIESMSNDNFKYIIDDYSTNLEVVGRSSINDVTDKVYHTIFGIDSRKEITKALDKRLDKKNEEYFEKYGVKLKSKTIGVESTSSPWKVLIKVKLEGEKENERFVDVIERNVSIEGLRDPLPAAILTTGSGIMIYGDTFNYGTSLSRYLLLHNIESFESYLFATSPLTIKKCPYDPYVHHGDPDVLKDCLDKGYFHESADGSCYLCRLEGKGVCPHYGMEVFIQPHTPLTNDSVSCSDHVVFHDHYNGEKLNKLDINSLILDSSHQKKYGLI